MLAPHALRTLLIAAVCAAAAFAWQRHGVTREREDRIAEVRRLLAGGRLQAASLQAGELAGDFADEPEAEQLRDRTTALVRANEDLKARRPAAARERLEQLAREMQDVAVVHLLLGQARRQLGDVTGAEAAFARYRELAPGGLDDPRKPRAPDAPEGPAR